MVNKKFIVLLSPVLFWNLLENSLIIYKYCVHIYSLITNKSCDCDFHDLKANKLIIEF